MSKKVAVVLAGCGVFDGAEIQEAVLTLLSLSRAGAEVQCFAPDIPQHHVVDHFTRDATGERRNVLHEAARIARGKIAPLAAFDASAFDALMFPGGFGVAKNLSSFAFDGADCKVNDEVATAIRGMHEAGKPIGALCIAPILLARLVPGASVTVGAVSEDSQAVEAMGAKHTVTDHGQIVIDEKNKLVTSPCYMLSATVAQIADDVDNAVKSVLAMC